MKVNHDKYHLLMSTQDSSNIQIAIFAINASQAKKLLGIKPDNNLKFDTQVENIF